MAEFATGANFFCAVKATSPEIWQNVSLPLKTWTLNCQNCAPNFQAKEVLFFFHGMTLNTKRPCSDTWQNTLFLLDNCFHFFSFSERKKITRPLVVHFVSFLEKQTLNASPHRWTQSQLSAPDACFSRSGRWSELPLPFTRKLRACGTIFTRVYTNFAGKKETAFSLFCFREIWSVKHNLSQAGWQIEYPTMNQDYFELNELRGFKPAKTVLWKTFAET